MVYPIWITTETRLTAKSGVAHDLRISRPMLPRVPGATDRKKKM
tara:strand:+ start:1072 stop:1203 length:132 start_codon:yes stop_codon:yes gene_type:complete